MRLPFFLFLALSAPLSAAVDYTAQIKPLLQTHCVKCHGATTQKARLRLDTAAGAIQGGGRGAAVLPGKAQESLLFQVISGTHDEVAQMPYKRGPLDSPQVALIQQWIAEGGRAPADEKPSDDRHWAYISPEKVALPAAAKDAHPVDHFIQARLAKEGLTLSAPAPAETQVRRLFLDLTGLPPSPVQVAAFVQAAKNSPDAYTRQADELLDSPHYGERWGRWWLDQARYADSNGYSIDAPRIIWPYRDWV
ncbi:MAG: DUF1549 domain-containing protein, partial [Verrucomicrobiota bacterium]